MTNAYTYSQITHKYIINNGKYTNKIKYMSNVFMYPQNTHENDDMQRRYREHRI